MAHWRFEGTDVPEDKQISFGVRVLACVRWISGSAASNKFAFKDCAEHIRMQFFAP